jgi:S-adenosylmethionine:tRNA ribosyltransferase-isomerase
MPRTCARSSPRRSPLAPELDLADYVYPLAPERIAQQPAPQRDAARLLVLDRDRSELEHARVRELPRFLAPGDLLVVNATRVVPARLRGTKESGGAAEALLLDPASGSRFRALLRTAGRQRVGLKLRFGSGNERVDAEVVSVAPSGEVVLAFADGVSPYRVGKTPLPPYIRRPASDPSDAERYQTVYARVPGSVAAPTAGLHLTHALLRSLAGVGIESAEVVLHVGPGTFRPLREEDLAAGTLPREWLQIPAATAQAVARTRRRGGRVVAVGTTTTRALEAAAGPDGIVEAGSRSTRRFLRPGCQFRVVDALLTNFHLPASSLLLLVAAFAGRERVLRAYAEAARRDYRFYSYGDAMLIL